MIIGCEKGGNYKRKDSFEDSYSMKVKCSFMLRLVPCGSGWNVMVSCGFPNHKLAKDLDDHDILGRFKDNERQFVNDMTKYYMALKYIIAVLKYRYPEDLTSVTQVYKEIYTYKTTSI